MSLVSIALLNSQVLKADIAENALHSDVLRLTALFTAARGRSFASEILAREGKTFQFEFLRPSHSLFPFFNRLTEQYRLVIDAPEEIRSTLSITTDGEPSAVTLDAKRGAGAGGLRKHLLEKAHERADWERKIRDSRRKKEDEEAGMRGELQPQLVCAIRKMLMCASYPCSGL